MNTQKTPQNKLEDIKVSLKLKLATLWADLMFSISMLIISTYLCQVT
ncbi:MAG TPA: hypothetical protein VLB84_02420 [Bacteroidia bacterium]|nr:hypothetical protein [Bacteroidia bacterium]